MKSYTVSELTDDIKKIIEGNFSGAVSVTGEVANFFRASSGHIYFALKDERAQLKAAYFKGYAMNAAFIPKNGDKVQVIGDITVYEGDGSYQIVVKRIDYDSVGDFWRKYEETKRRLEAEGLFNESRKRPLPEYINKVAVITSLQGAAIKDFTVTLKNFNAMFDVEIWGVPVQGVDAAPKIVEAIKKAGNLTEKYDVLVVMRGGGSLEDLSVFNDEKIARAVAASKVPTISAIGHERDITIIDHVADYRCATPTAAGATLSSIYLRLQEKLDLFYDKIIEKAEKVIQVNNQKLDYLQLRINSVSPFSKIKNYADKISACEKDLRINIVEKFSELKDRVAFSEKKLELSNPLQTINIFKTKIEGYENSLKRTAIACVNFNKMNIATLADKLKILDPSNVLNRGYALVIKNDKIITSIDDIQLKENIEIKLKDGYINSFVIGKKQGESNGKNTHNS